MLYRYHSITTNNTGSRVSRWYSYTLKLSFQSTKYTVDLCEPVNIILNGIIKLLYLNKFVKLNMMRDESDNSKHHNTARTEQYNTTKPTNSQPTDKHT